MQWLDRCDLLIVAVAAGVIVRPGDGRGLPIVVDVSRLIGIEIVAMKEMRTADSAKRAQRGAEVLMISRSQKTAASLVKARDATTVRAGQSFAGFDGKEPKLMKVAGV